VILFTHPPFTHSSPSPRRHRRLPSSLPPDRRRRHISIGGGNRTRNTHAPPPSNPLRTTLLPCRSEARRRCGGSGGGGGGNEIMFPRRAGPQPKPTRMTHGCAACTEQCAKGKYCVIVRTAAFLFFFPERTSDGRSGSVTRGGF